MKSLQKKKVWGFYFLKRERPLPEAHSKIGKAQLQNMDQVALKYFSTYS